MSEDTIGETGIRMLSVPCLESTAVVHAGRVEMKIPCSCGIDGQIYCHNNPGVLIVISCAGPHWLGHHSCECWDKGLNLF